MLVRTTTERALLLAGLWWVIAGGEPGSWLIGVPAVVVATWASVALRGRSTRRWSITGVARLAWFFVVESLRGGVDVARRALSQPLDVKPTWATHRVSLPAGVPRLLLCSAVGLLPGTLAVSLNGDELLVHSLSGSASVSREVEALERCIDAALPGERDGERHA